MIGCCKGLLISDQNYSKKGAINIRVSSGIFSTIPGFESVPAAFVLHSIDEKEISQPDIWVKDGERAFTGTKAEMMRIYLQEDNSPLSEILEESGYKKSTEIGLAMNLTSVRNEAPDRKLLPIELNDFLECEIELSRNAGAGPDGHGMGSGEYARLELHKIHAGYMRPFVYRGDGKILGSVKIAIEGRFCRLKNMLVHPLYRREGVATEMIKSMIRKAADLGMEYIGAYALEQGGAKQLYQKLGMEEVTRQFEWTKPLGNL